ncbi:unnamed protein product, partial [Ectocarpus sp. 4 AP-2014]
YCGGNTAAVSVGPLPNKHRPLPLLGSSAQLSRSFWGVESGRSSSGGRRTSRELLRLPRCCSFKSKAEGLVALAAGGRCSMPGTDNPRQRHGSHLADGVNRTVHHTYCRRRRRPRPLSATFRRATVVVSVASATLAAVVLVLAAFADPAAAASSTAAAASTWSSGSSGGTVVPLPWGLR